MSWFVDALHERNTKVRGAKNLNACCIGESGDGKSYAILRLCELYYNLYLNEKFPYENIVFTKSEFLDRIVNLGQCSIVIFDDSGMEYSSKKWFEELNQILGFTMQTYRFKIINVFFTLPHKRWLDSVARGMLHGQIIMKRVGVGVYYKLQHNPFNNKVYHYRRRIMDFKLPSDRLTEKYESMKSDFLNTKYKYYLEEAKKSDSQLISIDEHVEKVINNMDKFKLNKRLNLSLIEYHCGVSNYQARTIYAVVKKRLTGSL